MFSFWCLFWLLVLSCFFFYFLLPPCLIIFSCVHWCLIPNQSTVFVLLCSPWSLIVLLCCAALFFLHFLPGSLFVCELFFSHFFLPLVVHLSLLRVPWVFPVCFLSEDRKIVMWFTFWIYCQQTAKSKSLLLQNTTMLNENMSVWDEAHGYQRMNCFALMIALTLEWIFGPYVAHPCSFLWAIFGLDYIDDLDGPDVRCAETILTVRPHLAHIFAGSVTEKIWRRYCS